MVGKVKKKNEIALYLLTLAHTELAGFNIHHTSALIPWVALQMHAREVAIEKSPLHVTKLFHSLHF